MLYTHSGVLEAAVIGIPDAYRGEVVKAFVVLRSGQTATASELKDFCRERLVQYKVPGKFEFVDELPKTQIGKVLRRVLRQTVDTSEATEAVPTASAS